MRIVPIKGTGEPVEVLKLDGDEGAWHITIFCEGNQHRLTFKDGEVEILDHEPLNIEMHENVIAELAGTPAAAPCPRIQLWLRSGGLYIIEVILSKDV